MGEEQGGRPRSWSAGRDETRRDPVVRKGAKAAVERGPVVFLVGNFGDWPASLEFSYERAFKEAGCRIVRFDMPAAMRREVRSGRIGRNLARYADLAAWVRRANREMVLAG